MITILADTSQHVARAVTEGNGLSIALVGLALTIAGILVRGGILIGEHKAFRRETNARLIAVENKQRSDDETAITRQELDARFETMSEKLESMKDRIDDAVTTMREVLKR